MNGEVGGALAVGERDDAEMWRPVRRRAVCGSGDGMRRGDSSWEKTTQCGGATAGLAFGETRWIDATTVPARAHR